MATRLVLFIGIILIGGDQASAVVISEEIRGAEVIIDDLERCAPSEAILTDQMSKGFWNRTRILGTDKYRGLSPIGFPPDITCDPQLEGTYDIYVGTRAVNWNSDFAIRLSSEDPFTVISPPLGLKDQHWDIELPFRERVRLDGEKLHLRALGGRALVRHFRFVRWIQKKPVTVPTDNHVLISRDKTRHFAFPGVTRAANGNLLVVAREGDTHVLPGSDFGKIVLFRSQDGGNTWEERVTVLEQAGNDLRSPSIMTMADGVLILTSNIGVQRSFDHGFTWDKPVPVPVFSPRGVVEGSEGHLFYAGLRRPQLGLSYIDISRSADRGKTWEHYSHVMLTRAYERQSEWATYWEPALGILQDGRWLVAHRVKYPLLDDYLEISISDDHGRPWSWTAPNKTVPFPVWGYPAHILNLDSGAVICTYGYRKDPMGVRASISRDRGKTWDLEHEIILRGDGHGDLGYPVSIQLEDDAVFTVYYIGGSHRIKQHGDTLPHIAGTFWYPDQPTKPYVIRGRKTGETVGTSSQFDPSNASVVANPSLDIPSLRSTFKTVANSIFMSNVNDRLSTYSTSSSNFRAHERSFLPLICANPVIPGRTSCLRAWAWLYNTKYFSNNGRGPTILISPFNTLTS